MTKEEIQYEAQSIIQEWGSNDSAPYVEFVEKLASMELPESFSNLDEAAEEYSENILANNEDLQDAIEDAFKAGAGWRDTQIPKLPDSLDEAAEEYAYNNWEDNDYHTGASEGLPFDAIGHTEKCFKAGAEWMAGQGATCNGEIQMDFSAPADIYARRLSADYWNELGPALMKVEPGKVLIQIRKKQ